MGIRVYDDPTTTGEASHAHLRENLPIFKRSTMRARFTLFPHVFPGERVSILDLEPLATLSLDPAGSLILQAHNNPSWPWAGLFPHRSRYPTTDNGWGDLPLPRPPYEPWGDREPYPSSSLYPPVQRDYRHGVEHKVFPYDRSRTRVYPSGQLYPPLGPDPGPSEMYPSGVTYPAGDLYPGPPHEYRVAVYLDSISSTDGTISILVEKVGLGMRSSVLQRLNWYGRSLERILIGCASDTTLPYDLRFEDLEVVGEVYDAGWYDASGHEGVRNAVGDETYLWQGATDRKDPSTYTEFTDIRKLARYDMIRPAQTPTGTPLGIRWTVPPRLKGIRWNSPFTFESLRMETFGENE